MWKARRSNSSATGRWKQRGPEVTVNAPLVGHRHGNGYAAGAQGPAEGKAGDGAHASAAGDFLSHGAAHGAGGKRGQRQIRKYTLQGRLFPQPYCLKYRRELLTGSKREGERGT